MKSLLSIIFICMFAVGLYSQGFGIRAGANIANLTGDVEDNTSIVSWQFGAFVDIPVTEATDINIAALYSKKGAAHDPTDIESKLSYLEVPVLLRIEVLPPLFLQGGVYGSYLLSASAGDTDIKDSLKSGDYGIQFGAGVKFNSLGVDARYSIGMADVDDLSVDKVKNSVITLGVEYSF